MADVGKQVSASDWTLKQREFMVWLASPSEIRFPFTIVKLADHMHVNESTLHRWKQVPEFKAEVQKLITDSLADDYHDVMDAFKKEAKKGSFPHQKMYFEMMGVYTEKRTIDFNLIRDEAAAIAQELGLDAGEVMAEAQSILKAGAA